MNADRLIPILLAKWPDDLAHFYLWRTLPGMPEPATFLAEQAKRFCLQALRQELGISEVQAQRRMEAGHPDITTIDCPEKDENLTELISEQNFHPMELPRKIFIVHRAADITPRGANKLLKTLEEPHPRALILFLNDSQRLLLPTVQSRAVCLTLTCVTAPRSAPPAKLPPPEDWGEALEGIKKDPQKRRELYAQLVDQALGEIGDHRQLADFCRELAWCAKAEDFRNAPSERFFGLLHSVFSR